MGRTDTDMSSGRVMLMGLDRVFYLGLLGAPTLRSFGSLTIYTSFGKPFRLCVDGQKWKRCKIAVIQPYQSHSIETDDQLIGSIMLEPEAFDFSSRPAAFASKPSRQDSLAALEQINDAFSYLQKIGVGEQVDGLNVDKLFFGQDLQSRSLDSRIQQVIDQIKSDPSHLYSAEECAEVADLSFSRFLHLFKEELGVTFRKFRAWKRARNLLYHVNRTSTLTDIALEIGYPDSTHFSHSIRQVYGLRPTEIFAGSRRLSILLQEAALIRCGRKALAVAE